MNKRILLIFLLIISQLSFATSTKFNVLIDKEIHNYKTEDEIAPKKEVVFDKIKCSYYFCVGLKNGSVWYTGYNYNGAFGLGDDKFEYVTTWTKHKSTNIAGSGVTDIHAAYDAGIVITKGSTAYISGYNQYGVFGDGTNNNSSSWNVLRDKNKNIISDIESVIFSSKYSIYLKRKDGIYFAGSNHLPKWNNLPIAPILYFSKISSLNGEIFGKIHLAVKTGSSVYIGGYNASGQLGDGTTVQNGSLKTSPTLSGISLFGATSDSSFIVKSGTLYGTGSNVYNLINGDSSNKILNFTKINGAFDSYHFFSHNIYAFKNGILYGRGNNNFGQFGVDGNFNDWKQIGSGYTKVFSGFKVSYYIKDNKMYAAGDNSTGLFGIGHRDNIKGITEIKVYEE